jgi:hypothetical protein
MKIYTPALFAAAMLALASGMGAAPYLPPAVSGGARSTGQGGGTANAAAVPDWARLMAALASPDFAVRQRAQGELDALSPDYLEKLRALAEETRDIETQARLLRRARDMRVYLALHPKPLSLTLQNATLQEVAAAINREVGSTVVSAPGAPVEGKRFKVPPKPRSFVELYQYLNAQHPLTLSSQNGTVVFHHAAQSGGWVPANGFLVYGSVGQVFGQLANGKWGQVNASQLKVMVICDPRMQVVRSARMLDLVEALDDRKTSLDNPAQNRVPPGGPAALMGATLPGVMASGSYRLGAAHAQAKKIARVKASLRLEVAVDVERLTIEDIDAEVQKPITLSNGTFLIRGVTRNGVLRVDAGWSPRRADAGGSEGSLMMYTYIDSAGKTVGAGTYDRGGSSSMWSGQPAPGPVRLQILVPMQTEEVTVPIMLTNLPLPARPKDPP